MEIYWRILGISLKERVTKVDVLRRMHKEREIIPTIQRRKLEYIGRTCHEGREISNSNHYTEKNLRKEIHRKETKLMAEERQEVVWMQYQRIIIRSS